MVRALLGTDLRFSRRGSHQGKLFRLLPRLNFVTERVTICDLVGHNPRLEPHR